MDQENAMYNGQEQEKERKNRPIIYWVVILLLLGACAVMFYKNNQLANDSEKDRQKLMAQIDSVKSDRSALQADFDAASAKIDQLVSTNAKLDSNLERDKQEILELRRKIKSLMGNAHASKADLAKARDLIASLNDKTTQYEARIAELEKENAILTNKNTVLTRERDSTVTQNIAIKKVASALHCSNMRLEAVHVKRNGQEVETEKAKKANALKITFDIDENHIAESGNKDIYVRLVGPDGSVLSSPGNGSGTIKTAKGDQISFSLHKIISLTKSQPVKDVSLDWRQDGKYDKGSYLIEIFSEGYKVGSGNVILK